MSEVLTGGCQCGAVRYRAEELNDDAHICHCRMCQKAVGNAFISLVSVEFDQFAWTRGTNAEFFSSQKTARGFCAECGTPLYMRDADDTKIFLTLGTLDDPNRVPPKQQVGNEAMLTWFAGLHHLPGTTTTEEDWPVGARSVRQTNHQHPDYDTKDWPPKGKQDD